MIAGFLFAILVDNHKTITILNCIILSILLQVFLSLMRVSSVVSFGLQYTNFAHKSSLHIQIKFNAGALPFS